eukprot:gb/GFBE01049069.1/.p1 GENE.gb/GFBE01049069.1/~~gb/GFBE01049069.1/.p1  ORF type:complete len:308 (+),score=66.67 gb/GFBE01049069.1/:1-924(+)
MKMPAARRALCALLLAVPCAGSVLRGGEGAKASKSPRTAFCISGNVREGHHDSPAKALRAKMDQIDPDGVVFAFVNPCPSQTEPWWWKSVDHVDAQHPRWGAEWKGDAWQAPKCPQDPWKGSSFVKQIKPHMMVTYNETTVAPPSRDCGEDVADWPAGTYQEFFGWNECFRMVQEHEKKHGLFTAIVRLRPDACANDEECSQVEYCPIEAIDMSKIHMHAHGKELQGPKGETMYYDNFAIVPRKHAPVYFSTVDEYHLCRGKEFYNFLGAANIFSHRMAAEFADMGELVVDQCDCHSWQSGGDCVER